MALELAPITDLRAPQACAEIVGDRKKIDEYDLSVDMIKAPFRFLARALFIYFDY